MPSFYHWMASLLGDAILNSFKDAAKRNSLNRYNKSGITFQTKAAGIKKLKYPKIFF
jgi:hypothetical protein